MPEALKNISKTNLRSRRGPVVFGDILYGPDGACGPRVQQDFQLVLMHRGTLTLHWDDRQVRLCAGQGVLLPPGHQEFFQFTPNDETHHSWCAIAPDCLSDADRRRFHHPPVPAPIHPTSYRLFEIGKATLMATATEWHRDPSYYLHLGLALFHSFLDTASVPPAAGRLSAEMIVRRTEAFIASELNRPVGLADMAAAAGVSAQHLLKLFRTCRQQTPTEELYQRRLEMAADRLVQTGLSIKEIADQCGFANEFHFSRKFKTAYQLSPRQWRLQNWRLE